MTKAPFPQTSALSCPACGAPILIHGLTWTSTVGCPSCGSILERGKERLELIKKYKQLASETSIPLGTRCTLNGVEYEIIGSLTRCDKTGQYLWEELLLMNPYHGFAWLVNSESHWCFVRTIKTVTAEPGVPVIGHEGRSYRRFLQDAPSVRSVIGEFYWQVRRNDTSTTYDYITPPYMLSAEVSDDEVTWSHGEYLQPEQLKRALSIPWVPSQPRGVGMIQPNPAREELRVAGPLAILFIVILCVVHAKLSPQDEQVISSQSMVFNPQTGESATATTHTFAISEPHTNLMFEVQAGVNNSWVSLNSTLVNTDTGEQNELDAEVAYYYGSDSDGSWTEGSQTARYYMTGVEKGSYIIQWQASGDTTAATPIPYTLTIRKNISALGNLALAILAILLAPGLLIARMLMFEGRRAQLSSEDVGGSD